MPASRGITGFSGIAIGGGTGGPAGSGFPASTVSGGAYPDGVNIYAMASVTVPVVATTVTATKSVDTTYPFSTATVGDLVFATAGTSGLSAGVTMDAWVSQPGVVTVRYSNVSTANAAQIATNVCVLLVKVVA